MGDETVAVLVTVGTCSTRPERRRAGDGDEHGRRRRHAGRDPRTVPSLQVTVLGGVIAHVPCVLVAAVGVRPAGSVSVTTTSGASAAPSLVMSGTFSTLSW